MSGLDLLFPVRLPQGVYYVVFEKEGQKDMAIKTLEDFRRCPLVKGHDKLWEYYDAYRTDIHQAGMDVSVDLLAWWTRLRKAKANHFSHFVLQNAALFVGPIPQEDDKLTKLKAVLVECEKKLRVTKGQLHMHVKYSDE